MNAWVRGDVPAESAAGLWAWLRACGDAPGKLPPGTELVQTRLIRSVGRGELAGLGTAFVKVMGFPRGKDRLRYAHRALPARHEARVLETVAARAPELPVPLPLAWASARTWGFVPRFSALVTQGLEVDPSGAEPTLAERIAAARRLCEAGVEHGDLHRDNFVRLADGRTAALDLQSARVHRGAVDENARVRVAAKLIETEAPAALDALVAGGLVSTSARERVGKAAERLRAQTVERRVRRCMQESSEFVRSFGVAAVRHLRRAAPAESALVRVPEPDALRLWIGDRVREVLDGTAPLLAGMVRPLVPQLGVRPAILVGSAEVASRLEVARPELLAAFARYRALARPA